jgi:hypothetical protein
MSWKNAGARAPGAVSCALVLLFCASLSQGATSQPMTIRGTPAKNVTAGTVYSFCPTANLQGTPARYFKIQNKPAWASFDTKSGLLRGRPASNHAGTYSNVKNSVTDGKTSLALPAFSITVQREAAKPAEPTKPAKVLSFALSWLPPTENEDGSALTNLAHYKIYRGTAPSKLQLVSTAHSGLTRLVMDAPPPGRHYFAITAVNKSGQESERSPVISGIFE